MVRVALLDDFQKVALHMADWSALPKGVRVRAFRRHVAGDALVEQLKEYDVAVVLAERTPFPASVLQSLPNLKLLIGGGTVVDLAAATELGILVCNTGGPGPAPAPVPPAVGGGGSGTSEITWGLILSLARHIPQEDRAIRRGRWQTTVGDGLVGKTLGVLGLGRIGSVVAQVGLGFGMKVIAWSQNLTKERAQEVGATLVSKEQLLSQSDFVTIHLKLSDRTRGLLGQAELARMKPTAYLVNTSRGPIVNEAALVEALRSKRIAGAGLDVFDAEPLPKGHPFFELDNTVLTPHLGYVLGDGLRSTYARALENIQAFLHGQPVRLVDPRVLERPNVRLMR